MTLLICSISGGPWLHRYGSKWLEELIPNSGVILGRAVLGKLWFLGPYIAHEATERSGLDGAEGLLASGMGSGHSKPVGEGSADTHVETKYTDAPSHSRLPLPSGT